MNDKEFHKANKEFGASLAQSHAQLEMLQNMKDYFTNVIANLQKNLNIAIDATPKNATKSLVAIQMELTDARRNLEYLQAVINQSREAVADATAKAPQSSLKELPEVDPYDESNSLQDLN